MRLRPTPIGILALAVFPVLLLTACGGSSSASVNGDDGSSADHLQPCTADKKTGLCYPQEKDFETDFDQEAFMELVMEHQVRPGSSSSMPGWFPGSGSVFQRITGRGASSSSMDSQDSFEFPGEPSAESPVFSSASSAFPEDPSTYVLPPSYGSSASGGSAGQSSSRFSSSAFSSYPPPSGSDYSPPSYSDSYALPPSFYSSSSSSRSYPNYMPSSASSSSTWSMYDPSASAEPAESGMYFAAAAMPPLSASCVPDDQYEDYVSSATAAARAQNAWSAGSGGNTSGCSSRECGGRMGSLTRPACVDFRDGVIRSGGCAQGWESGSASEDERGLWDRNASASSVPVAASTSPDIQLLPRCSDHEGGFFSSSSINGEAEGGGVIRFTSETITVSPGASSVTIPVQRSGSTNGQVAVSYGMGSGAQGSASSRGTVSFGNGETSRTITLPLSGSTSPRSFTVSLTSPTRGAVIGSPGRVTVTIPAGTSTRSSSSRSVVSSSRSSFSSRGFTNANGGSSGNGGSGGNGFPGGSGNGNGGFPGNGNNGNGNSGGGFIGGNPGGGFGGNGGLQGSTGPGITGYGGLRGSLGPLPSGKCQRSRSLLNLFDLGDVTTGSDTWTFPGLIDGNCPITAAMLKVNKTGGFGGPLD